MPRGKQALAIRTLYAVAWASWFALAPGHASAAVHAAAAYAPAAPAYAKWGLIAVQETKAKYPSASIVDYLHIGRQDISAALSEETFKLWLRQGNREFGVRVVVRFRPSDDRLVSVRMEKTSS
ncbi:DUF3889 domain-containing protein [Cohnella nanjingensis]|uniref:DUF3889 domain-containing protein n=1 Tax=Cohnella nanjingensis TaxID=1387779 RepID=A0A7X0VDL7_9BACL|nr:DUF3889 domain-containing protein [Cohnella nanjingensis]MBB6669836.1 DUF3889 domain-containing protein [Cohnella nanjingensis]